MCRFQYAVEALWGIHSLSVCLSFCLCASLVHHSSERLVALKRETKVCLALLSEVISDEQGD